MIFGERLFVIYDPPHLLKCIRNNMLNYDILYGRDRKRATWKDIEWAYARDSPNGYMRAMPKVTDAHVNPLKIKKMKVSNCAQVFSSSAMRYLFTLKDFDGMRDNNEQVISDTVGNTAELIGFFDKLFDSVNGNKRWIMKMVIKES